MVYQWPTLMFQTTKAALRLPVFPTSTWVILSPPYLGVFLILSYQAVLHTSVGLLRWASFVLILSGSKPSRLSGSSFLGVVPISAMQLGGSDPHGVPQHGATLNFDVKAFGSVKHNGPTSSKRHIGVICQALYTEAFTSFCQTYDGAMFSDIYWHHCLLPPPGVEFSPLPVCLVALATNSSIFPVFFDLALRPFYDVRNEHGHAAQCEVNKECEAILFLEPKMRAVCAALRVRKTKTNTNTDYN